MKQFGKILKFELKGYLKNKVFTGVTIFLVVAIAVAMFIPNIISAFKSGTTPSKDLPVMLVYAEDETLSKTVKEYFTQAFTGYNVKVADGTLDDIKSQITSGSVECAFVLNSPSSYTYYVNNLNMRDSNQAVANTVLQEVYRVNAMIQNGLSPEQAAQLFRHMWIQTFGLGVLCAAGVCRFSEEEISKMLGQTFIAMMLLIESGRWNDPPVTPVKAEKAGRLGKPVIPCNISGGKNDAED